jgi:uncharacterized protein (DUF488 family)
MESRVSRTQRTVWTIGHSNHPLETFLDLLVQHRIGLLVDVRSSPYSRHVPHFGREALCSALKDRAIEYLFLGDLLGGRAEDWQFYDAAGHVLYDRVAQSPPFRQGIDRLLAATENSRLAMLCGEEDPSDCHRRLLVGRVLRDRGILVEHIRGNGQVQTEDDLAAEECFRKTKGQLTLFDIEEPREWKSSRSVLPSGAPRSSSRASDGQESDR